jgi:putative colanic acid biosynthesis acetyltransferase WcaF
VWILNLEEVSIGSDVCVSQEAFICSGSHKASSSAFDFDNAPIRIEDGVWLCAQSAVLRGVTVGSDSVIGARSLVTKNVPSAATVLAPVAAVAV